MSAWTDAEEAILRQGHLDRARWVDLMEALPGRSASMIRFKACRLGLVHMNFTQESKTETPSQHMLRDQAFQRAMRRAIKAGHENPPIGIIKDDTPFVGLRFYGARASLCGSPSQMCAEAG